jgi:hypothetical protein
MVRRSNASLIRFANDHDARFVANVIICHHSNANRKLRGLCNLLELGVSVSLRSSIDDLVIDGDTAAWQTLETAAAMPFAQMLGRIAAARSASAQPGGVS